jgi:tRNA(adenine34) deaminase
MHDLFSSPPPIPPPAIQHPEYLVHYRWMSRAIALAQAAGEAGEVPVGAVIVDAGGEMIAEGENRRERDHDPCAHAEILALRGAGRVLETWHLNQCTLYVTLEPCPMCAGAIVLARLGQLVYGTDDLKTGAIRTVINILDAPCSNHSLPVLGGILESTCRQQLQSWFMQHRHMQHRQ